MLLDLERTAKRQHSESDSEPVDTRKSRKTREWRIKTASERGGIGRQPTKCNICTLSGAKTKCTRAAASGPCQFCQDFGFEESCEFFEPRVPFMHLIQEAHGENCVLHPSSRTLRAEMLLLPVSSRTLSAECCCQHHMYRTLHNDQQSLPTGKTPNEGLRSGTACTRCKARKQGCDQNLEVCWQCVCVGKGLDCVYLSLQDDVCGQHTLETLAAARKKESHAWETKKAQDPTWGSDYKDWMMHQTGEISSCCQTTLHL